MRKIFLTTIILFSILLNFTVKGQTYSIGEKVSFKSNILNEERSIFVYLPASYKFTNKNHPVLYLLDGATHFHHASGIVDFLSASGLIPETIVIALKNTNRNKDFSPTPLPQRPNSGGAEDFMNFFKDELFPFVERNYRINSYNIIMGHSLGGTFITYSFLNNPQLFNSYISLSPYLMYDKNILVRKAESKLKSKYAEGTNFYMTVGDEEVYFDALDYFANIIETNSPKGLNFKYTKMLDNDHGSVPHLGIYDGLLFIFSGWKINEKSFNKGLKAIDNHYKKISEKYDYNVAASEFIINQLGYKYLKEKNIKKAIIIFKENIIRFPTSANAFDSLGEAYEKTGQLELALTNYEIAVQIARKNKDHRLGIFENNRNRLQTK
jgi:hypothetical protein